MFDDPRPEFSARNGLKTLPIILETHLPLDLVIVMLGTTDTKEMMNVSSEKTAEGMRNLIKTIKNYKVLK
jgi:lysophospholipase L1-like esterase